jgi:predicted nuclease of predicted toxin-antitoxin system
MRILLDHCVPKPLRRLLPQHTVKTAREMGWDALRNGALLATAATAFDVLLTVDQNIKHQQNVATLPLTVIVLIAASNTVDDLKVLMPQVETVLAALGTPMLIEVSPP